MMTDTTLELEPTLLLLLAARNASDVHTREDAAIEAEDILTQADEALAF